jgi:hypothetical protein
MRMEEIMMKTIVKVSMLFWIIVLLAITSCTVSNGINEKVDGMSGVVDTSTPQEYYVTQELTRDGRVQTAIKSTTPTFTGAWSGEGRHMWIRSQEIPIDVINWKNHNGYEELLSITYGDGIWLVTLLNNTDIVQSVIFIKDMNKETIDHLIERGGKIEIICPSDEGWLVVTTQVDELPEQKIISTDELPLGEISKAAVEGYWVTDLRYCKNQWVVLLTKTDDIVDQKIEVLSEIGPIRTYIDNKDSYLYTSIVYDGKQWVVARSILKNYSTQSVFMNDIFQKDIIQQVGWFGGYDNIKMFFGNGQWIYTFTR